MNKRFKILLTASVLASGLSIVLPLQAQQVDKTGRFPARAQTAQTAQSDNMGGMTAGQMNEMMENCNNMMRSMQQGQMPNQQGTAPSGTKSR